MMREECWNDPALPDAVKMRHIQTITGSQYQRKERKLRTLNESKVGPRDATFYWIEFANKPLFWH